MSWLRGSTTVANVLSNLYDLLTGNMAAASTGGAGAQGTNGLTIPGGTSGADAWTRLDVANGVIRSKSTQACLYGQWNFYRGAPRFEYQTVDPGYAIQLGKPTFTSPTGTYTGTNRAYFRCYVTTSNTVAGNLTNLVVTWEQRKCLDGSVLFSGTLTGWSGSSATVAIRDNVSLTLTLGGSDTLAAGASAIYWLRGYSATYTQGIDYFPDAGKIDTTQTIVLSNTSGGANNYTRATDYDLVGECDANPALSSGSYGCGGYCGNNLYGAGVMHGIHWKTGGAPPATGTNVFLVSCFCFVAYAQLSYSGITSLSLQPCEYYDPVNALPRHSIAGDSAFGSAYAYTFVSPYTGSGTAGTASFVNYWISVKANKIVIALQGDTGGGVGGQSGFGTFQKYTVSSYDTVEKTAWVVWSGTSYPACFAVAGRWPNDFPTGHTVFVNTTRQQWMGVSDLTFFGVQNASQIGANPNAMDGKWWLYNIGASSAKNGKTTAGTISLTRAAGLKGTLAGVFQVSGDNWNDYDELVDGASIPSNTYLLQQRALNGAGGSYAAILEE